MGAGAGSTAGAATDSTTPFITGPAIPAPDAAAAVGGAPEPVTGAGRDATAFPGDTAAPRRDLGQGDEFFGRVRRRIRMFANFQPFMRLIGMGSHLSLFLAVGVLMIKGRMNAGDFLILGSAMNGILSRLQQVATINEQYQNAIVSSKRFIASYA